MAIASTIMSQDEHNKQDQDQVYHDDQDHHDHDMVMPGFRFHPTEEELIEFYLRRKVEGKRFNVELITFLDLYRYDPWELPALAAIGEKEWFFYVPRDRKYRNGDRPNRVTTSGYWKATGADRMIRTENFRSIGLKKTLVFYSGKAPKGIRTSWIMNEYRLPHHETEKLQKAEISLCRVYKRPGVEDHPSLPRSLPTRASSSRIMQSHKNSTQHAMAQFQAFGSQSSQQIEAEKMSETSASSSTDVGSSHGLFKQNSYMALAPMSTTAPPAPPPPQPPMEEDTVLVNQSRQFCPLVTNNATIFTGSSFVSQPPINTVDDLQRLLNYQQASINHYQQYYQNNPNYPNSQFSTNLQPQSSLNAAFGDRLWEWNPISDQPNKDYSNPFK